MQVMPYFMACLMLILTIFIPAQESRSSDAPSEQIREHNLISQMETIAVCGETCSCGMAKLVTKQYGPCTVNSSTGSCSTGAGACCVCAATQTIAVCGEQTCSCSDAVTLTKVAAPCSVTSSAGKCEVGAGACCICAGNCSENAV